MNDTNIDKTSILLLAIGNIGRSDDGLGWRFADAIAEQNMEGITIEYRYQLQVEDALLVAEFPIIIFADASEEAIENGFTIKPCHPATQYFFSSHMQSPETILYLTETLYQKKPKAFTLAIEGQEWDLHTGISNVAKKNLQKALGYFSTFLQKNLQ